MKHLETPFLPHKSESGCLVAEGVCANPNWWAAMSSVVAHWKTPLITEQRYQFDVFLAYDLTFFLSFHLIVSIIQSDMRYGLVLLAQEGETCGSRWRAALITFRDPHPAPGIDFFRDDLSWTDLAVGICTEFIEWRLKAKGRTLTPEFGTGSSGHVRLDNSPVCFYFLYRGARCQPNAPLAQNKVKGVKQIQPINSAPRVTYNCICALYCINVPLGESLCVYKQKTVSSMRVMKASWSLLFYQVFWGLEDPNTWTITLMDLWPRSLIRIGESVHRSQSFLSFPFPKLPDVAWRHGAFGDPTAVCLPWAYLLFPSFFLLWASDTRRMRVASLSLALLLPCSIASLLSSFHASLRHQPPPQVFVASHPHFHRLMHSGNLSSFDIFTTFQGLCLRNYTVQVADCRNAFHPIYQIPARSNLARSWRERRWRSIQDIPRPEDFTSTCNLQAVRGRYLGSCTLRPTQHLF